MQDSTPPQGSLLCRKGLPRGTGHARTCWHLGSQACSWGQGRGNTMAEELGLRPSKGPANCLPGRDARHSASFMLLWLQRPKQGAAEAAPPRVSGEDSEGQSDSGATWGCPSALATAHIQPLSRCHPHPASLPPLPGPLLGTLSRVKMKCVFVSSFVGLEKSGKSFSEEVWSEGGTGAGLS